MCAVCRQRFAQPELLRVSRSAANGAEGGIAIDARGRDAQGRGAYVGPHRACWEHPDLGRRIFASLKMAPSAKARAALTDYAKTRPDRDEDARAASCPRLESDGRQT